MAFTTPTSLGFSLDLTNVCFAGCICEEDQLPDARRAQPASTAEKAFQELFEKFRATAPPAVALYDLSAVYCFFIFRSQDGNTDLLV